MLLSLDEDKKGGFLVLDRGDDIVSSLDGIFALLKERGVVCDFVSLEGIGATDEMTLGFFSLEEGRYIEKNYEGDHEIVSFIGNILKSGDGAIKHHYHVAIASRDGETRSGHLISGKISVTLELALSIKKLALNRVYDEATKCNLIKK
jgi:predicted DNA-binding protein with PD1-like motif